MTELLRLVAESDETTYRDILDATREAPAGAGSALGLTPGHDCRHTRPPLSEKADPA
jgi:hypothetical protein